MTEGVAVWLDGSADDRVAEAAAALAGAGLARVDVRALWVDWRRLPQGVAYPVAGAVVEALVRAGGVGRLREALRDQTLEGVRRVYGPPLDAWLDQLEERIAARVAALIAQRSLGGVAPD
jgi:dihydroxyacid dehydratase/phosphogluconate dehydratase